MIYILLGIILFSTWVCYREAKRKGLDVRYWIMIAALLGPLAIPLVLLARSAPPKGGE
jgi:hypothetical protein